MTMQQLINKWSARRDVLRDNRRNRAEHDFYPYDCEISVTNEIIMDLWSMQPGQDKEAPQKTGADCPACSGTGLDVSKPVRDGGALVTCPGCGGAGCKDSGL